ncbi:MAG: PaaI family thioesterase [Pseudomonadota bacterium]
MNAFDPIAFFNDADAPPAPRHLGWKLLDFDIEKGWIKLGFTPKPEFLNATGHVQGGFIAAMLDDTVGPAVVLKTSGHKVISTIDLHTHFLRPVKLGSVTTEGQVTEMGRSIAFMEGKLFDLDGKLCARATTSAKLFDVARFADA